MVYQQVIDPASYGNMVGEYNALGEQTARYIYGHGLVTADNSYYSFDGNGNTSELTNGAGEIVNFYIYRPFGKPIKKEESRKNPFQFAGQLGIQSSGNDLLYMRNRFYAMETGRFISEDPIGLAGKDINLYRYVENDPVNWIDPEGLATEQTSGARPSTLEKHEKGKTRKKIDRGGEKGDKNRRLPRKRPGNWKGPWPPKVPSTYPSIWFPWQNECLAHPKYCREPDVCRNRQT